MTRAPLRAALVLSTLLLLSLGQAAAETKVQTWQVTVRIGGTDPRIEYTTTATDYELSANYRARLFAVGPYGEPDTNGGFAENARDILTSTPHPTLVVNGGFSTDSAYTPAGLLLVNGHVAHPPTLAKVDASGWYEFNAIVCFSKVGKIDFLPTADLDRRGPNAIKSCSSALQTRPFVIRSGVNQIAKTELGAAPLTRTMLGRDSTGQVHVITFTRPVHLFAAAEFLRKIPHLIGAATVKGKYAGEIASTSGLGLKDVVSLDGGPNTLCVYRDKALGDLTRTIPSAVAFVDQ